MSTPHFPPDSLTHFVHCLQQVPDPRPKHGTSPPFRTILALVFLGNITTLAEIERWSKLYFPQFKKFLRFKRNKGKYIVPHAIILRKLSLDDL